MLCFVPGGSADHQNYIRENCYQLTRHTQHTEIRHYPFWYGPKGFLRAKHVGCGLKFYALAPQARTVLRRLTFEMCAWEMEIFKTVAHEVKVDNPGNWTAVGVLLPGLGEHESMQGAIFQRNFAQSPEGLGVPLVRKASSLASRTSTTTSSGVRQLCTGGLAGPPHRADAAIA